MMDERFGPAGFFVMRTPALAWDVIEGWTAGLPFSRAKHECGDGEAAASAFSADVALLKRRLRALVKTPMIEAALYFGSPDLFEQLGRWLDGDSSAKARNTESAVVRYLMRMAGRATPFGLFAGVSIGRVGQDTAITVPPITQYVRHTRVDTEHLFALAGKLRAQLGFDTELRFRTSETIYDCGSRLRYYEAHSSWTGWRTYSLVDVEPTPYLRAILEFASRDSSVTLKETAEWVCSQFNEISFPEALEFVKLLIDANLLCEELSPPLTGEDPAIALVTALSQTEMGQPWASEIGNALADIQCADEAQSEFLDGYKRAVSRICSLHPGIKSARVLRTDLRKAGSDATIGNAVVSEVQRGIELLARIMPPSGDPAMRRFVRDFEARYQGMEIPLLDALDEESGIGFDNKDESYGEDSLMEGIRLTMSSPESVRWDRRTAILHTKLCDALSSGGSEVALSAEDIATLSTDVHVSMPTGISALVAIASSSCDDVDRGEYLCYLRKVFGPNSAKLMARFCYTDPMLQKHVVQALRREEECDRDVIHAEIVHLPHAHAGNVICRPRLREYEIPVFDRSGAPSNKQIPLTDLAISIQDGNVILRSVRWGRRVLPHLTCAHAFRKSGASIYRFLASLEEQGTFSELNFSWGAFAKAPFLPRVTCGRLVLALAQWNVPGALLSHAAASEPLKAFVPVQHLRQRLKLPRFASFVDGDNYLPLDFDNALSVESFLRAAKQNATITLQEMFPPADKLVAKGEEGKFQHEIVLPFLKFPSAVKEQHITAARVPVKYSSDARRYPGSDWLFVKAYCGPAMADRVLTEVVAPLITTFRSEAAIDRWFFIRYADPEGHLRLRLHGTPSCLWKDVAPRLLAALRGAHAVVHRVMIDTYDQEQERYGGREGMAIAEKVFEADSDAAVSIISEYSSNPEARWRLGVRGMDALLDDCGVSLAERAEMMDWCLKALTPRYQNYDSVKLQIGKSYRQLRPEIEKLFHNPDSTYLKGIQALRIRSDQLRNLAASLNQLQNSACLPSSRRAIVSSYLHMSMNRLFRSNANAREVLLYNFLLRLYGGIIARGAVKDEPANGSHRGPAKLHVTHSKDEKRS